MTYLLDHPSTAALISILAAVISGSHFRIYDTLLPIYEAMEGILAGTMFSLLGFVIAGLAIVISIQGSGLVKYISEQKPALWHQVLAVFSNTAKLLIGAAFVLLIMNGLNFSIQTIYYVKILYVSTFTFLFMQIVLQLAKIIYVLESIAVQSSAKARKTES